MKKSILILFLVLVAISTLAARGNRESDSAVDYTNPENLYNLVQDQQVSYTLVDVRTPAEYSSGHIPTAINISVDIIEDNPPQVDKDSLVILYCRSGNRSGTAARILRNLGYENIVDFGGISRWSYKLGY